MVNSRFGKGGLKSSSRRGYVSGPGGHEASTGPEVTHCGERDLLIADNGSSSDSPYCVLCIVYRLKAVGK